MLHSRPVTTHDRHVYVLEPSYDQSPCAIWFLSVSKLESEALTTHTQVAVLALPITFVEETPIRGIQNDIRRYLCNGFKAAMSTYMASHQIVMAMTMTDGGAS